MNDPLPQFLRDLLASPPRAGDGVHAWLYRVARQLHAHRTPPGICDLLAAALLDCGRPVPRREIEVAVENSRATAWQPHGTNSGVPAVRSVPKWPARDEKLIGQITAHYGGLPDLWEASPIRLDDNEPRTDGWVKMLFPAPDTLLCCGKSAYDFDTLPRQEWCGRLQSLQFIVPSPMKARSGMTKAGKESKHCLANTGPRRFLVTEFDAGSIDQHAAILLHLRRLNWPLAMVVHSGGKSLHGWFNATGFTEEELHRGMSFAVRLGADPATWTRSQFVRMPDGTRDNGKRQTVYYFDEKEAAR